MKSTLALALCAFAGAAEGQGPLWMPYALDGPGDTAYLTRPVEGWTVHVERKLLQDSKQDLGHRSLRLLANKLYELRMMVPADKLVKLQEVPIWLDTTSKKPNMQYHPSRGWLKANGYDVRLAKSVHIPSAESWASARHTMTQPWAILHELAHAYHDRVLGFDNARVREAYDKAVASKKYESVLRIDGRKAKHYALTNPQEFFAEMTEAYFGTNDFYPFVRGELREYDPATYELMRDIWGQVP
jgi:hypothetical protein